MRAKPARIPARTALAVVTAAGVVAGLVYEWKRGVLRWR